MLEEIEQVQKNGRLLYSEPEIDAAITVMVNEINATLSGLNPLVLCVMNGGMVITGKLLTQLAFPLTLDAINATRYGDQTTGGDINWLQTPVSNLKGRTVLVVDDILDQGLTLQAIYQYCLDKGAARIYSAVLINKQISTPKPIQADFIGLMIADHYVYGYGMDYKGYLRNIPGIYACS